MFRGILAYRAAAARRAVALLVLSVVAAIALPARTARGGGGGGGGDEPSREYQLKAAFIFNFVQFVEWPDDAGGGAKGPIVITVVGDNPFGSSIEQVVHGKNVRGREVTVRYVQSVKAIGRTHVLFVAAPESGRPAAALQAVNATPALTISDTDAFMPGGGVIRFFSEDNKLRFEINPAAAQRAGLKMSAKLLQLARLYKEG